MQDLDDPRLADLREASVRWRRFQGPRRRVVDQVCLVPDVPTFLAAVAAWDERHFFPILIDDPRWTLSFVRAFRPARIVRCGRTPMMSTSGGSAENNLWQDALTAVSRGWIHEAPNDAQIPPAGAFPRQAGPTPPGAVLSHPGSPMLAAAVALAAGRFQPLLRVERIVENGGSFDARGEPRALGFDDALNEARAIEFVRKVEARIRPLAPAHDQIGDDLDFLTLAGDWPYRYRVESASNASARGERALDDLIGRVLPAGSYDADASPPRWAYTGRILGDPPASVYRAMCSLFLQPESALLWDTYGGGAPWEEYRPAAAATILGVIRPDRGAVVARSGEGADLESWHRIVRPVDRFGLLMMNSSGEPRRFAIRGGPGRPADVPFGAPAVVSMIHSFSAASPDDPSTIAGRFLDHGAYIYFGSMFEPYLTAFRTPTLLAKLIAAQVPLGAAFREGRFERFGFPWRLVYLGDPLYRVHPSPALYRPVRMSPDDWGAIAEGQTAPPSTTVEQQATLQGHPDPGAGPSEVLDWCHDAALLSMLGPAHEEPPHGSAPSLATDVVDLRPFLASIDRGRLDPRRRLILDELMIDQSTTAGATAALLRWLLDVDPKDRSPRAWRAIETTVMSRLAELSGPDDFAAALDLWADQVVRPWPPGSEFPAHLIERFAAIVESDPARQREYYRRRLADVLSLLKSREPSSTMTSALAAERKRIDEIVQSAR